uniref:ABC transporter ATP-binding protein n=1 Tax=Schlesneria paludicola TaxID=360056 RepID=A0A7C4LMQ8_9PLAN
MIALKNLGVRVGTFQLSGISLEIAAGEYAVLMGRTGCGKTSLLEAICGLRAVAEGQVWCQGREVTTWDPADRDMGYVPQDLALFPTLTVREHLAFALRIRRVAAATIRQRIDELAQLLGLGALLDRTIHGLSGGERQRVALGRALSFHPAVLLLDEPLSALDEQTRHEMYALLKMLRSRTGVTTLHVTHHRHEAQTLADRLFVLENGHVREASLAVAS